MRRPRTAGPTILFLCVGLCLSSAANTAFANDLAARVIVLANSDDPDSLRIARHYASVRGVPAGNIVALELAHTEAIGWGEFVATLWQPLLETLLHAKWIDAIPMTLTDAVGRRKYAPHGHRIAALVVCRGVPLKIGHDPALFAEVPPFTARGEFRTNAGAVDAELSLLALPNYVINAFVPNPLFQNERPSAFDLAQIVKVARLDGPTAEDALALVDRAVAAERAGLQGRAYIDIGDRDPVGNAWLEAAAAQVRTLGFDGDVDRAPATLPLSARIDAPALYFGWYASDVEGAFTLPGFRFPPGAIAVHIHSYSATTLRSATRGWTAPLVARGVTATVGNVNEPYLQLTHQPHLLLRGLARGDTLADAAYFALPALSWQAILVGDPLYRPFAVPLEEQLRHREQAKTPVAFSSYAVLRKTRLLDAAGKREEAAALLRAAHAAHADLALGVELAQRRREAGDVAAAAAALAPVLRLKDFSANEWALARQAAQLLEACAQNASAVEVWRTLLAGATLPRDLRVAWLPEAKGVALAAKNERQALAWQRELDELRAEKK